MDKSCFVLPINSIVYERKTHQSALGGDSGGLWPSKFNLTRKFVTLSQFSRVVPLPARSVRTTNAISY